MRINYIVIKKAFKNITIAGLIIFLLFLLFALTGCDSRKSGSESDLGNGWKPVKHMKLKYAKQFSVYYYKDGYKLIRLHDGSKFLVVPEGKDAPNGIDKKISVLRQPINRIYLAATASMCLFDRLGSIDNIKYSGAEHDDWYVENARKAMEEGRISFVGKYNQPDYEALASGKCDVAIESTMINHVPAVKKKLEEFDIPVFTDQSSLENHPLGRTEWIKVYGAMLNKEPEAEKIFDEQVKVLEGIDNKKTNKTVAFFTILPSGQVMVRKSGDYVSKMINLAGGKYVFRNIGDHKKVRATVTIDMEDFYKQAKSADILIYNNTIGGTITSISQLEQMNPLMKEFKAVKNGNVWYTGQNLYQETTGFGQMISDMHKVFVDGNVDSDSLTYLHKFSS
ncbi:ABC transporter substrate-binding protein [Mogibacterium diversum]